MTHAQAITELMQIYMSLSEEKKQALDVLMAQVEKTCDIEKSNFDVRQYKLDTDTAYECGYNAGLQAQADGEYISRTELLKAIDTWDRFGVDDTNSLFRLDSLSLPHYVAYIHYDDVIKCIKGMPSVTPQEPTGHWISHYDEDAKEGWYECDRCHTERAFNTDYCPDCGARMVEPQESEDKE